MSVHTSEICVTYFVSCIGYVIEVSSPDGSLIFDCRGMDMRSDRGSVADIARRHAVDTALRYGVQPESIVYDREGEDTENELFG